MTDRRYHYRSRSGLWLVITTLAVCCVGLTLSDPVQPAARENADQLFVVDCLLPGQVRRLGNGLTYLTPRRPIKTPAVDCEIRGGEYTSYDRANYSTALKIWLPQAKQGDPKAQTYVGEIYEKGLGTASDYVTAAAWYRKASEQGYSAAQLNLGYLYEKGLGVEQNIVEALNWYRQASGLVDDDLEFASTIEVTVAAKDQEIAALQQQSEQRRSEAEALRQELTQAQQTLNERKRELEGTRSKLSEIRLQLKNQQQSADDTPTNAAELERLKKALEQREAVVDAQRRKLVLMEAELTERGTNVADTRRTAEQKQQILQDQLQTSVQEGSDLQSLVVQTKQQLRDAQAQLQRQTPDASLAEKLKVAEQKRQELEDQLRGREQNARQLRLELAQTQRELDLSRAKISQADKADAELLNRIEVSENEKQQLVSQLTQTETQTEETQQRLAEAQSSLTNALSLAKSQNAVLVGRIEEAQTRARTLEERRTAQERDTEVREQQLAQVRQELELTKIEFAQQQNELVSQQQTFAAERRELQQVRDTLMSQLEGQKTGSAEKLRKIEGELKGQEVFYVEALAKQEQQLKEQQHLYTGLEKQFQEYSQAADDITRSTLIDGPKIELIDPPLAVTRGVAQPFASLRSKVETRQIIGRVTAPAGLMAFSVNDKSEEVDQNGMFSVTVPISSEKTGVLLAAVDKQGQRSSLDFILQRQPLQTTEADSTAANNKKKFPKIAGLGNYHALVIGNNKYANMQELTAAKGDAKEIGKVLKSDYGFKVQLLLDATRYDIMSALNELKEELSKTDNLLIYFAGHGSVEQKPNRDSAGYWLPVDAEANSNANWISNTAITAMIETMPAKHVLVIADSCYSGTLSSSSVARMLPEMSSEKKAKHISVLAKTRARIVITSGGLKPVLDSVGGGHSVFAQAFLETLRQNNDIIDVWGLFKSIKDKMQQVMQQMGIEQEPQYSAIQHAGHEGGVFFFAQS